jgi:hypothetical protein
VLRHNPLLLRGNHEVRLAAGDGRLFVGTWGYALGLESARVAEPTEHLMAV